MASAVTPKSGEVVMTQSKLKLTQAGRDLKEPETKPRYAPPEHFKLLEGSKPLVDEVLDSNTELWLVRVPPNEITTRDLVEKKLRIKVDSTDGKLGHFLSCQGEDYNIWKQDLENSVPPYAIVPTESGQFRVRRIRRQVAFLRNLSVTKNSDASATISLHDEEVVNPNAKTPAPVISEMPTVKSHKKKRKHENPESR